MLNRNNATKALFLTLASWMSACVATPDITGLQVPLETGSVDADSQTKFPELLESEFGQRVKFAVENNPAKAQSDARYQSATANQVAARGAFLPRVSLGMNARTERIDTDIADVTPFLRVSQLLYDGGAASGDLAAAKARVVETRGEQLQTASAIALKAIEAYVAVRDHREIQKILVRNVETHQEFVRQTKERFDQGAGSNADVLAAESRLADAQTRLADANARTDRAEANFREVFGQTPGPLDPPVSAPRLALSDVQIIENSPLVRRADAALIAARAEQTAAIARRKPSVEVAAFADRDDNNDANFGIDMSFNYELDSTGRRRAAISNAEANVREAEFARENVVRSIRRELEFIRSDQQAGAERLRAARIAAQTNADNVTATRAQFTIGRRSLIEILDAQRDFVNAQERQILAEQSFFLTEYSILSLTGDILDLLGVSSEQQGQSR